MCENSSKMSPAITKCASALLIILGNESNPLYYSFTLTAYNYFVMNSIPQKSGKWGVNRWEDWKAEDRTGDLIKDRQENGKKNKKINKNKKPKQKAE